MVQTTEQAPPTCAFHKYQRQISSQLWWIFAICTAGKHQLESMQYSTSVFYKSHKKYVKCLPGCNSFLRTYSSTYSISILCVHIMTPPMMKIGFMIYLLNIILPTHHRLHILEDTIWS